MNWLSLLSIFATPLGAIINKGIGAASAGVISWAVAKGLPLDSATSIVSEVALAASTVISGFAATQGVHIPMINADPNNGVTVVDASEARTKNLAKVNAPKS